MVVSIAKEERIPAVGEHVWLNDEELIVYGVEMRRGLTIDRDGIGLIVRKPKENESKVIEVTK